MGFDELNFKRIIILAALSVVAFFLLLLFYIFFKPESPKSVALECEKISTENNLLSTNAIKDDSTNQSSIENIKKCTVAIKNSLLGKATYMNTDTGKIKSTFQSVDKLISEKKYKNSLSEVKKAIDGVNQDIENYENAQKKDEGEIGKTLNLSLGNQIEVVNSRIKKPWAKVAIALKGTSSQNLAIVFLKNDGRGWAKVAGPGTDFNKNQLVSVGLPQEILANDWLKNKNILMKLTY